MSLEPFAAGAVKTAIFSVMPGLVGEMSVVLPDAADGVTLCDITGKTVASP